MQQEFCGFYETTSTTSEELFEIVMDFFFPGFSYRLINVEASATIVLPVFLDMLTDCLYRIFRWWIATISRISVRCR